jgi:FemAB-related protein (PEP-CTERM system-associated)
LLVEELGAALGSEWDDYVEAHSSATCYHLRAWNLVAERAYRLHAPLLVARAAIGGPIRGVLPLFVVRNARGGYTTNGLFGAYGAILADSLAAGNALLTEATRITRKEGCRYLMLKSLGEEPLATDLDRRDLCVIAKLPLDPSPDVMWRGFRDKMRNCIRKAQKSDLDVRAGPDQLSGYYDVLAENMHRKGTPIYGKAIMRQLLETLGDRAEIVTLWRDGAVVSGALVIYHKQTVYVPFASSRPAAFKWNPNNLLYWEIIKRACARGMTVLDFGRSPQNSSALAFKLGWGAAVTAQPFYVYTARGTPPKLDIEARGVKRMIRLWQRLPRWMADAAGPAVCRRFLA